MKYLVLCIVFFFSIFSALSQSGTVTSSGSSSGSSSLNVDFSLGQIFYQSQIADNLDYKEGIIQSFYVNGDTIEFDFIGVKAYPNPTTRIIYINLGVDDIGSVTYAISSPNGQYVGEGDVDSNPFALDVSTLANGVYFVHLFKNQKLNKTIKIIKY